MGRWLTTAAPHAPRALIGFDYSDVVHTAYENSRHLKHVHIVRADIFRPPFRKRSVDVCYSIGVVHHTPDPEGAFASLLELVKDDGALSVWVYGQENNGWIEAAVTPLRERLTSKVPDPVLHGLSRVAALQLFAAAQVYARVFPQPTSFSYDAYTRHIAKYPRRYLEHIVYDHFVPQLAAYLPGDEVERWATARSLAHTLTARNANSWRLLVARNAEALARWSSPPRTEAVVDGAQPVNS
jgi:SAM-dependent methyltransferase